MNMIEQIKADLEIGTKGRFSKVKEPEWSLDTGGENSYYVIGPNQRPLAIVAVEVAFGQDARNEADMRRFCRVPDMEAALIAAEELAKMIEELPDDEGTFKLFRRLAEFRAATGST